MAREAARQMIELALKLEVEDCLNRLKEVKDEQGKALVVRNGKSRPRKVNARSGTMEIQNPRVNDECPGKNFSSVILPPYVRRSPNVFPVLY